MNRPPPHRLSRGVSEVNYLREVAACSGLEMNMCHEWMSEVCGGVGGESKWCQHAFGNRKPEETRGGV